MRYTLIECLLIREKYEIKRYLTKCCMHSQHCCRLVDLNVTNRRSLSVEVDRLTNNLH